MMRIRFVNKVRYIIKTLYYFAFEIFCKFLLYFTNAKNIPIENNILILITDGLGDNILRIELIRKYIKFYQGKNLYFFLDENSGVNELIDLISSSHINYLYFDNNKWLRNPFYMVKKIRQLYKHNFSDLLFLFTISNKTITPFIKSYKVNKFYYYQTDDISRYSLLDDIFLYNTVTGQNVNINDVKPNIKNLIKLTPFPNLNVPKEYIVVGIGASLFARRYPLKKFLIVLEWLIFNNYKLIFLGKGKADLSYYKKLASLSLSIKLNSTNLIEQLSFVNSLVVLSSSKLFIGVESGLFNAASFLNIPLVVIYGGGHYGRFKHERDNSFYISNKMPCFSCNWHNCHYGNLKLNSAQCISSIEPQQIIKALGTLLNQ